jgi:hypothetical protein
MKTLIKISAVWLALVIAPVYAQSVAQETGAQPQVPPPTGGHGESPMDNSEGVVDAPQVPTEKVEGAVTRAIFTSGIQSREPVDQLTEVTSATDKVYFFTELKDLDGQTVKHRWLYNGQVVAEVSFPVGGAHWRVWSSKALQPDQLGTWTVEVVNGENKVMTSSTIENKAAAAPPVPVASGAQTGVAAE